MNPATKAQIRATAEFRTEYPASTDTELGKPPERTEGMSARDYEAACRRWAKPAKRYVCGTCDEVHKTEYDAEQCCPPEIYDRYVDDATGEEYACASDLAAAIAAGIAGRISGSPTVPSTVCPVCGSSTTSPHEAVECCLWKEFAAPARWAIATALDGGSTWTEELAKLEGGAA